MRSMSCVFLSAAATAQARRVIAPRMATAHSGSTVGAFEHRHSPGASVTRVPRPFSCRRYDTTNTRNTNNASTSATTSRHAAVFTGTCAVSIWTLSVRAHALDDVPFSAVVDQKGCTVSVLCQHHTRKTQPRYHWTGNGDRRRPHATPTRKAAYAPSPLRGLQRIRSEAAVTDVRAV